MKRGWLLTTSEIINDIQCADKFKVKINWVEYFITILQFIIETRDA